MASWPATHYHANGAGDKAAYVLARVSAAYWEGRAANMRIVIVNHALLLAGRWRGGYRRTAT
jgi:hypothetical protein